MKGIILAGGYGTRLMPLTKIMNKHLLPVYDQPMIMHPLNTLKNAGIKDIVIITSPEFAGDFMKILGSGKEQGIKITYKIQDEIGGIAHALAVAEDFANGDSVAVILGDNIFEDKFDFSDFKEGGRVFLKEVPDAERFGVAEIQGDRISNIEEKPKTPKTNLAVTGLYIYDNQVFDIIRTIKPSGRGEMEITDVNNVYIKEDKMGFDIIKGFWSDAGTFESLHRASNFVWEKNKK